MTRTEIKNIDELFAFLKANYDTLSDKQFEEIVQNTLRVYVDGKGKSFDVAKARLLDFYLRYRHTNEAPLFISL
jgi:hypothetical protein